jgi:hypothetical protein
MWYALTNFYKNRKMALRDKIDNTRMAKGESVASYLTWLKQVKDELAVVGDIIPDS